MRYRLLFGAVGLCAAVTLAAGCRSAVSTHVTPDPYQGGWDTKKVRGIPVTVMVPTHLEVRVVERRYYQPGGNFEPVRFETDTKIPVQEGTKDSKQQEAKDEKENPKFHKQCNEVVTRLVTQKVREKAQLFMVDAARPGAGTLGFSAEFNNKNNEQFFSSYNSKVEDKTLNTIAELVPGLPGVLGNLRKARAIAEATTPADASLAMAYTDHIVAVKVFDVNDPNLTECVRQFMAEYVNCHPVCPPGCATSPK